MYFISHQFKHSFHSLLFITNIYLIGPIIIWSDNPINDRAKVTLAGTRKLHLTRQNVLQKIVLLVCSILGSRNEKRMLSNEQLYRLCEVLVHRNRWSPRSKQRTEKLFCCEVFHFPCKLKMDILCGCAFLCVCDWVSALKPLDWFS
jgi:hypothetical protein